jgi:hypothetical protein
MPEPLYLPDGTPLKNAPPGVTQQQINAMAPHYYMGRAAKEGALTVGDKVYSGSAEYPNTYVGHALAFLDTYAGGNQIAQGVRAADRATGGGLTDTAQVGGRAMTAAAGAIPDMAVGTGNAIARHFNPDIPVAPSVTEAMRQAIGVQDLPADAPLAQRLGEGALAGAAGGGLVRAASGAARTVIPTIADAIYGAGSEGGAEIGEKVAGAPGRAIGGVLPAIVPSMARGTVRLAGATRPSEAPIPGLGGVPWQTGDTAQPFYRDAPTAMAVPAPAAGAEAAPAASGPPRSVGSQLSDAALRYLLAHGASGSPVAGLSAVVAPYAIDTARAAVASSPRLGSFAYGPSSFNWPAVAPQMAPQPQDQQPLQ